MYTQAQVEDSDCIVGANIGLGLLMLFAAALTAATLIVAGYYYPVNREKRVKIDKAQAL